MSSILLTFLLTPLLRLSKIFTKLPKKRCWTFYFHFSVLCEQNACISFASASKVAHISNSAVNILVCRDPEIIEPCNPSPCGANAVCKVRNNAGSCSCLPDYYGDPYVECRPECTMNSDCPNTKSCVNQKCVNPCIGTCGSNAECYVANHSPYCTCSHGYTGNPSVGCYEIPKSTFFSSCPFHFCRVESKLSILIASFHFYYTSKKKAPIAIQNPCIPSPCGAYSQCRESNGHAICSCVEYCIGSPPSCRPECTLSSECFLDKACINQRCVNPCVPGTCGDHARCQVINHNPICSCSLGYTGDPFIRCTPEESKLFGVILLPFIGKLSLRSYSVGR